MKLSRLISACFLLSLCIVVCLFSSPELGGVYAYLFALSSLTLIPATFLRSGPMSVGTLLLLTPTLLMSLDAIALRLGWLNLFPYIENTWDTALGEDSLQKAAGLALAGNAALWLGHFSPLGGWGQKWAQRARRNIQNQRVRPDIVRIWGAFAMGIGARLFMVRSGIGGYFSESDTREEALPYIQILLLLESLSSLALVLYYSVLLRQQKPVWTPFGAMFTIELATATLLGFKGLIVTRFLLLIVMYAWVKRRIAWQLVLTGILALLIIFPLNMAVRASFNSGEFRPGDIGAIQRSYESSSSQQMGEDTFDENARKNMAQVGRNSAQLEPFAMVVQYIDRTGNIDWGVEYGHFVYGYIPRALWPDKPSPTRGGWIYREVYGRTGETAVAQTVPGNFYLNFGAWGVVLGLFVYGSLCRAAGDILLQITSPRYMALIPSVVLNLGMPQSDLGAQITGLSQALIFNTVVLCFLVPGLRARAGTSGLSSSALLESDDLSVSQRRTPRSPASSAEPAELSTF